MKRKIDIIALVILIATAVNCGLVGIFEFNVISWMFGEQAGAISRIINIIVAIAGLWCTNLIIVQTRRRTIAARLASRS